MFLHALLLRGKKCYSHTFELFRRYENVFDELCMPAGEGEGEGEGEDEGNENASADDVEVTIMVAVSEVWSTSPGSWSVLIERLLRLEYVLPPHVVFWALRRRHDPSILDQYTWNAVDI